MLHPVAFVWIAFLVLLLICLLEVALTRDNAKVFVVLVIPILCAMKILASPDTTNLMLFYFGGFVMHSFVYAIICFGALGCASLLAYEERQSIAHAKFTMLHNAGAAAA